MKQSTVWFVTGASKGLGLSLVKKLLEKGYKVAATTRNTADLVKATGEHSNLLPLSVKLDDETSVGKAVEQTVSHFGGLDVVVNNAGYGLVGSLEELTDAEARRNFDINVFGCLNVIRAAMPYLRKQESGHVFNISSIGGITGNFPGWGIYCATKFAVDGFTEALAAEVKEFGVKVTIVNPGYFRTEFLNSGSFVTPVKEIADYKAVRDSQAAHQQAINGNQPGDPDKAADVLIDIAGAAQAPLHLILGEDAYNLAQVKLSTMKAELEQYRTVTVSTAITA